VARDHGARGRDGQKTHEVCARRKPKQPPVASESNSSMGMSENEILRTGFWLVSSVCCWCVVGGGQWRAERPENLLSARPWSMTAFSYLSSDKMLCPKRLAPGSRTRFRVSTT